VRRQDDSIAEERAVGRRALLPDLTFLLFTFGHRDDSRDEARVPRSSEPSQHLFSRDYPLVTETQGVSDGEVQSVASLAIVLGRRGCRGHSSH